MVKLPLLSGGANTCPRLECFPGLGLRGQVRAVGSLFLEPFLKGFYSLAGHTILLRGAGNGVAMAGYNCSAIMFKYMS